MQASARSSRAFATAWMAKALRHIVFNHARRRYENNAREHRKMVGHATHEQGGLDHEKMRDLRLRHNATAGLVELKSTKRHAFSRIFAGQGDRHTARRRRYIQNLFSESIFIGKAYRRLRVPHALRDNSRQQRALRFARGLLPSRPTCPERTARRVSFDRQGVFQAHGEMDWGCAADSVAFRG